MKIDNFALTNQQTCPAKHHLRIEQGWTVRRRSAALGFGASLHLGLGSWYAHGDLDRAVVAIEEGWPAESPIDDYRTKSKCIDVMHDYARTYPSESFKIVGRDTNPMVEVSFALETGRYLSCLDCGFEAGQSRAQHNDDGTTEYLSVCPNCGNPLEPIEYGGIFDTLVDFSGQVFILEHKSTSRLGAYYFSQFKPNNQVSGYVWAAQKLTGRRVGGAIINAIGVYKASSTKFERSITTRNQGDLDRWMDNVVATCEEIQQSKRTGFYQERTSACTLYGLCEYHGVHILTTEIERQKRLENDYIRDPWDFERRDAADETSST